MKFGGAPIPLVCAWALATPGFAEAESPVGLSGGVTAVGQRSDDDASDSSLTASLDLYLSVSRKGGRLELYVEGGTTPRGVAAELPQVNADAGTALNRELRGRLQVSELKYDFDVAGERGLAVGLVDLSAYLDTTRINNDENLQFLAAPFVNNPTIELPDYTLGAVFRQPSRPGRPRIHAAVAASSGLGDTAERSYSSLLDVDAPGRGLFAAIETGWTSKRQLYRLGVWHHGGDHDTLDRRAAGRSNFGAYGAASRVFGRSGFNLRAGFADPEISAAQRFASLSWVLELGRQVLGVGLAGARASRSIAGSDDMAHAELYLSVRVGRELYLTPSLQRVWNADFSAAPERDRTSVLSLRLHRAF